MSTHPFQSDLNVKESLMCSFAFFDLFEVAPTKEELFEFHLFTRPKFDKIESYLEESPLIHSDAGRYALSPEVLSSHLARQKDQAALWKKVKRWRFLFELCPFVRWVSVCNSLSFGSADAKSDIDLFIVCKTKRMFVARAVLTLLTSLFGIRRHGSKVAGRFCLSFYLSEETPGLQEILQEPYDIYMAFWLQSMKLIAGDCEAFDEFMQANEGWLFDFFKMKANSFQHFRETPKVIYTLKFLLEKLLGHDALDDSLRKWQMDRIYRKLKFVSDKSGTKISETMLKFHNKDMRTKIRNDWVARVDELL